MNATVKELVRLAGVDRTFGTASTDFYDTNTKRLNVWEEVTNHTARRTFATNVYQLGIMSLGELMSLTGHESESSLMTYLNVTRLDVEKASAKLREAFKEKKRPNPTAKESLGGVHLGNPWLGIYEAAVEFYGLGVGEVMRLNLSLQNGSSWGSR